ncbi:APC family permease [Demequina sediminicola]|uniref:APC family permease n=1 Tax=Demequina sediminicola TaxID=1095026 RepID=UPI00128D3836|nr:amino acid permease [Demequina sediminicola]
MTLRTRLALPVFGAGILSAVLYAPDAVVDALRRGSQQGAIPFMAVGVVLIMLLLGFAYRSNVHARPDSLGDYGLVRDVLGRKSGVVTGASVLVDYLFTVAVSVAALTQLVAFLIPQLQVWDVPLSVGIVGIVTVVALRVIRERARIILGVWFGFLLVVAIMFVVGVTSHGADTTSPIAANAPQTWSIWFSYAGAIASGAVMVTGIEHLAASAPNHAKPRGIRAGRTLIIAVTASAMAFFLVAILAWMYRITGWSKGPILLQVAQDVFNNALVVWIIAGIAAALLYAAVAAVFRRFSNLTAFLARDAYLPRQLTMRNDRAVLRGGVLLVATASAIVVALAGAEVATLIHLYVIGVFTSIVLSQIAMVRWVNGKLQLATERKARLGLHGRRVLHVAAAVVAAAVWIVVLVFNFLNGAWIAVALIASWCSCTPSTGTMPRYGPTCGFTSTTWKSRCRARRAAWC